VQVLGTTVTNQNWFHEEMKSRLNSGNACYVSVQNLLSFRKVKLSHIKKKLFPPITF